MNQDNASPHQPLNPRQTILSRDHLSTMAIRSLMLTTCIMLLVAAATAISGKATIGLTILSAVTGAGLVLAGLVFAGGALCTLTALWCHLRSKEKDPEYADKIRIAGIGLAIGGAITGASAALYFYALSL